MVDNFIQQAILDLRLTSFATDDDPTIISNIISPINPTPAIGGYAINSELDSPNNKLVSPPTTPIDLGSILKRTSFMVPLVGSTASVIAYTTHVIKIQKDVTFAEQLPYGESQTNELSSSMVFSLIPFKWEEDAVTCLMVVIGDDQGENVSALNHSTVPFTLDPTTPLPKTAISGANPIVFSTFIPFSTEGDKIHGSLVQIHRVSA